MRKFSAHYIFTGTGRILNKGIISLTDEGVISEIVDTNGELNEPAGVEFYSGIITPGFINAHCHLELSHLRDKIPEHLRLPSFLKIVNEQRISDPLNVELDAVKADSELWRNGVVAVGDISNTNVTFPLKSKSKIVYHTFVEALGISSNRAERAFTLAANYFAEARKLGLLVSIVPHSPYAVSNELFNKISGFASENNSILSMHSQESPDEDIFYRFASGNIFQHFTENLKLDLSSFLPTGRLALESVIDWLPAANKLLLVHNIQTLQKDIDLIVQTRSPGQTWFVLCPRSNLFIENRLPDIDLFRKNNLKICLGTDGLSSNRNLSVLEEMKTIQTHFPGIPFSELVIWATRNGAEALSMNDWGGTIEIGKRPGINLITGMDLQHLRLQPQSKVKRLM
ncbi:MAG: amidohydrolase family protein [Mariniphaga sp.]